MVKPKGSKTPSKPSNKNKVSASDEKKQSKISFYFQKTTNNQENENLFSTYKSVPKSSKNILKPNLKKFISQNKSQSNFKDSKLSHTGFSDKNKTNPTNECLSNSDSDLEIIECTPEPLKKRIIISKKNDDCDSPEIIPSTPYSTTSISKIPSLTKKYTSLLEPNLKFNRSRGLLSKSLASKSLSNPSKNNKINFITNLTTKRDAETGTGVSPNAKRCNGDPKVVIDVDSQPNCKVNLLKKVDFSAPSEQSCSEDDSSFSILLPPLQDCKSVINSKQEEIPTVVKRDTEGSHIEKIDSEKASPLEVVESEIDSKSNLDSCHPPEEFNVEESVSPAKDFKNDINEFLNEDSLDEILSLDFDKLSPFKIPPPKKIDDPKDKYIEKFLSEGLGSSSFAVKGNFGRHIVGSIQRDIYKREILLELISPLDRASKSCLLTGFWYESVIKEGDIVHILFAEEKDNKYFISNDKGIVVINPDFMVSGTSIVSGVFCQRKAVLNERFKGYEAGNKIMTIGSLVHQLFQEIVKINCTSVKEMESLVKRLIKQPSVLRDLYGMNLSEAEIFEEMKKFVPLIQAWSKVYLSTDSTEPRVVSKKNWSGRITAIHDIEENFWSPRFGIKGKIDLTVQTSSKRETKVMPLELKTGKPSFSVEHKGQVTLYSMMMSDRRRDPQAGLLLYLRDGSMAEVPAGEKEKKGLLQLRNELVKFLSQKPPQDEAGDHSLSALPDPLDRERLCSNCAHLLTCSALQKVQGVVPPSPHAMSSLVPLATEHLSESHLEYFRRWCLMLQLEIGASANEASIRSLWCHDAPRREASGTCLCNMSVRGNAEDMGSGYFLHTLGRESPLGAGCGDVLPQCFQVGESVVVSSGREVAFSMGVVYTVGESSISLVLDRDLGARPPRQNRSLEIDRCEYQNTMSAFFTNVATLMSDAPRSRRLRQLLIDRARPEFTEGVDRNVVAQIRSILVNLNKEQQRAVLRSLLAKDYSILKGFPGTGKTSTIVGLVRILSAIGHSVLLTSYTHSAVDNILLKLKEYEDVPFLRLGKSSRIHKDLLRRSDAVLTKDMNSLKEIEDFYESSRIVATTCLGMGHVLFRRKHFDFCILDEASQVLEAASLGPLLFCSRFVLVGDALQLPPVIKSSAAKSLGMMQSLMERLDDESATVCLTMQYRMNEPIMAVANHLIYDGRLQCATDHLKSATLRIQEDKLSGEPAWLRKMASPNLADSVLFVDTLKEAPEEKDCSGQPTNPREAQLILSLLKTFWEIGVPFADIGVITPYRAQVKLLKERTSSLTLPDGTSGTAIEVNTVDQYQGRDKSVILYSCVRSGLQPDQVRKGEILNDIRRLNVAVTRARTKLIVFGDLETLRLFPPFQKLLSALPSDQIYRVQEGCDEFSWREYASTQPF